MLQTRSLSNSSLPAAGLDCAGTNSTSASTALRELAVEFNIRGSSFSLRSAEPLPKERFHRGQQKAKYRDGQPEFQARATLLDRVAQGKVGSPVHDVGHVPKRRQLRGRQFVQARLAGLGLRGEFELQ